MVTGSGLSFRLNPITGAPVDANPGTSGTNPDAAINGATTTVTATAYTNAYPTVGGATTLFTLDDPTNSLFIQNPPNNGTQTTQKTVTVNGNPLDFTGANGFDVTVDHEFLAFTAPSAQAYLDEQNDHPLAVAGRAVLDQQGRSDALRERMLAIFDAANEDSQAFRVTARYVIATARCTFV